ncbi:MAG: D-glycerate dehydrogenase [Chloroflexi bacterium]|nr:D-glycerate dehydrogenase [Chloroflexota bacterium]
MNKPHAVITRRIAPEAVHLLQQHASVWQWNASDPVPRAILLERIGEADALLALLTERVDDELLAAAPRLRIVANMAVGYDNVDVAAARRRSVIVTNTPGVLTETSAEFALALIMAATRRLKEAMRWVERGHWTAWDPLLLLGIDLTGATLGLVGYGRIAAAVARRAHALGMRVLYHARSRHIEDEERLGVEYAELPSLLALSDVVSLHVPLSRETYHLIGESELRLMKRSAFLVNTARGGVIDPDALVRALRESTIAGAALDVTEPEPLTADHPLVQLDNCLVVPHIASASIATRTRMATLAVENIIAVLSRRAPLTPVL